MAEHKRAIKGNNEKSEEKHRVREQDSQPLSDKFHSWEQGELSIGKTPFSPRIDKHAELLSLATSDEAVHNMVMRLQQTYGNHYVQHLLNLKVLQAKLTVNNPNDVYEHEADRVAKVVTKAIDTQPQRQTEPEEEEEEPIQTKAIEEIQRQPVEEKEEVQTQSTRSQAATVSENLENRIKAARGIGHPLSDNVRLPMERAFKADFSEVRVHTDSEADMLNQQLSAKAFTSGQDVFFRESEYSPGSDNGRKLIAHELTHVVQQTGSKDIQAQEQQMPEQGKLTETIGHSVRTFTLQRNNGGSKLWKGFKAVGKAIGKGAKAVGKAIGKGAKAVGKALGKAAVVGGESIWRIIDFIGITNRLRSYFLEKKFKVEISGGKIFPFSNFMISAIDDVLSALPREHLTKNSQLKAIKGAGVAEWEGVSAYDPSIGEIGLHRFHIPSLIYLALNKGSDFVLNQIDKVRMGALPEDAQSKEALTQLYQDAGIPASPISVMGTDVTNESLFKWTLRHEIGHSVDKEIGWVANYANDPRFGRWEYYQNNPADLGDIAEFFLRNADVGLQTVEAVADDYRLHVGSPAGVPDLLNHNYWQQRNINDPQEIERLITAAKYIDLAKREPWLRNDGGGQATLMGDGRFQYDSEEQKWCSYNDQARQNKVSNYQFMNRSEWFAEAYAAYYGPDRGKLSPAVRAWFEQDLPQLFGGKAEFQSWKNKIAPPQ